MPILKDLKERWDAIEAEKRAGLIIRFEIRARLLD